MSENEIIVVIYTAKFVNAKRLFFTNLFQNAIQYAK